MSEIFKKNGNYFRACLYCGQDVLIQSASGNAFSMVIHDDPKTGIICQTCAQAAGAYRSADDYDEAFAIGDRFFLQYADYWMNWRQTDTDDFEDWDLRVYEPPTLSTVRAAS